MKCMKNMDKGEFFVFIVRLCILSWIMSYFLMGFVECTVNDIVWFTVSVYYGF